MLCNILFKNFKLKYEHQNKFQTYKNPSKYPQDSTDTRFEQYFSKKLNYVFHKTILLGRGNRNHSSGLLSMKSEGEHTGEERTIQRKSLRNPHVVLLCLWPNYKLPMCRVKTWHSLEVNIHWRPCLKFISTIAHLKRLFWICPSRPQLNLD